MKKGKILVLVILLILLCGCNVKEEVIVDPYGKVSQKVVVPMPTSGIKKSGIEDYAELVLKQYRQILNVRKYTYDLDYGEKTTKIIFKNNFDNLCEYVENTIFSQYVYQHIKCTEEDGYITIENMTDHIDYCGACADWPSLNNVTFSLTLPVKAVEDDADYVDENTYVWKYDKNTEESKDLYIKISKKDLNDNLKQYEQSQKTKNKLNKVILIIIVIGVIILSLLVVKKVYKKMEENKLDY